MSFFRDAVSGGADCGPSNPLQNLLKHSDRDTAIQHDRMNGGPNGAGASAMPGMRTAPGGSGGGPGGQEAMERFFAARAAGGGGAFDMEGLRRELETQMPGRGPSPAMGGPSMEAAWASQAARSGGRLSPEEMAKMDRIFAAERMSNGGSPAEAVNWQNDFASQAGPGPAASAAGPAPYSNGMYGGRMGMGMGMGGMMGRYAGMGFYGGGGGPGAGGLGGMMSQQPLVSEGKGKGKLVELSDANWEAEFARIGSDDPAQAEAKAEIDTGTTTDHKPRDDMTLEEIREMAKEEGIDVDSSEADAEFLKSLEATWKNLQATMNQSSLADQELAQWEAQYGTNFADPDADDGPMIMPEFTPENVSDFLKNPLPYPFQTENPFMAEDFSDPYAEGQRLLASGAPLSTAALAFEAACQKGDNRAWRPLGETQAADEKENLAIRAFEKAVELSEPLDAQKAWLALAISWVNEGQEMRALATLEKWLQDTYPAALMSVRREPDASNPWDRHSRTVDMFLAAARAGPTGRTGTGSYDVQNQAVDADVQVGLGVLFYANSEYERAKDCFEAALSVNPSDFLLWNRLGATLANGGSPETAIDAYRKALELRPTFTRAIYNLGVSCLNVGCFKESAEHLLAALSLHGKKGPPEKTPLLPEGDGSDNLWHTLRRAFLCMERTDLAERAKPGTDPESFRADGFEF